MTTFTWDHVHLRSPDPEATARWYQEMLSAEVIRTPQPDGSTRIDLMLGGSQKVFLAPVRAEGAQPAPDAPYLGLEHIGLTVPDIDAATAELKRKGVRFTLDPTTPRPGVRIAFLRGPENVSIELIQRG
jgi:lactoylglutathione lyase